MKNNELRNKLTPIKNYLNIAAAIVELDAKLSNNFIDAVVYGYQMHLLKKPEISI